MNTPNQTILLVEDDPDEIFLVQRASEKAGLNNPLRVARDGQEAIDYLSHLSNSSEARDDPPPALVLLDLKMPRKNGFDVLEWLRQQPGLKRLVVIVMSSSNETADINRAYDLGANSYVVKPVDFKALTDAVKLLTTYWLAVNLQPDLPNKTENSPGALMATTQSR